MWCTFIQKKKVAFLGRPARRGPPASVHRGNSARKPSAARGNLNLQADEKQVTRPPVCRFPASLLILQAMQSYRIYTVLTLSAVNHEWFRHVLKGANLRLL